MYDNDTLKYVLLQNKGVKLDYNFLCKFNF